MDYPISVPSVGLVGGKFVDEDPLAGTPGSLIPAKWGNAVTEEILKVITSGGLVPDEENNNQLLPAIKNVVVGAGVTPGRLIGVQVFDTVGAFTYTKSPGITRIRVRLWAGGAGGSGAAPGSSAASGSAGGYAEGLFDMPGNSLSGVIGGGGNAGPTGSVGPGIAGGASSLGGLISATGGAPSGGAGGLGTGGYLQVPGQSGQGFTSSTTGGQGGSSYCYYSALPHTSSPGDAGICGGGGAGASNGGGPGPGGKGKIIIEGYA